MLLRVLKSVPKAFNLSSLTPAAGHHRGTRKTAVRKMSVRGCGGGGGDGGRARCSAATGAGTLQHSVARARSARSCPRTHHSAPHSAAPVSVQRQQIGNVPAQTHTHRPRRTRLHKRELSASPLPLKLKRCACAATIHTHTRGGKRPDSAPSILQCLALSYLVQ